MGPPSTGLIYIQEDFPSDRAVWWLGGLVGCREVACPVLRSRIPCLHLLLPYKEREVCWIIINKNQVITCFRCLRMSPSLIKFSRALGGAEETYLLPPAPFYSGYLTWENFSEVTRASGELAEGFCCCWGMERKQERKLSSVHPAPKYRAVRANLGCV